MFLGQLLLLALMSNTIEGRLPLKPLETDDDKIAVRQLMQIAGNCVLKLLRGDAFLIELCLQSFKNPYNCVKQMRIVTIRRTNIVIRLANDVCVFRLTNSVGLRCVVF